MNKYLPESVQTPKTSEQISWEHFIQTLPRSSQYVKDIPIHTKIEFEVIGDQGSLPKLRRTDV